MLEQLTENNKLVSNFVPYQLFGCNCKIEICEDSNGRLMTYHSYYAHTEFLHEDKNKWEISHRKAKELLSEYDFKLIDRGLH